jgi:hypothetical protein
LWSRIKMPKKRNNKKRTAKSSDDLIKELRKTNIHYGKLPTGYKMPFSNQIVELIIPFKRRQVIVTSGAVALNFGISASEIDEWAARFQITFLEYVFIGSKLIFDVQPDTTYSQGEWQVWSTESTTSNPTSAMALNTRTLVIPNTNANSVSRYYVEWKLREGNESVWLSTATTNNNWSQVLVFADTATFNFNSSDSNSRLFITGYIKVLFRGFNNA